jgi:hypothetical protein
MSPSPQKEDAWNVETPDTTRPVGVIFPVTLPLKLVAVTTPLTTAPLFTVRLVAVTTPITLIPLSVIPLLIPTSVI